MLLQQADCTVHKIYKTVSHWSESTVVLTRVRAKFQASIKAPVSAFVFHRSQLHLENNPCCLFYGEHPKVSLVLQSANCAGSSAGFHFSVIVVLCLTQRTAALVEINTVIVVLSSSGDVNVLMGTVLLFADVSMEKNIILQGSAYTACIFSREKLEPSVCLWWNPQLQR